MSYGEQQKEIETIRERKITVKLSAADCDRLAIKCGEHGLTIGELIENFVGDLVGGTYPMRRKTPCFSYGDIRRVHRIYASN